MRYVVWSDTADDLMFEASTLRNAREGIKDMLALDAERGDHRYFPLSIMVHDRKSPYRRQMRVVETYTLKSVMRYTVPNYVRENGETVQE